MTASRTPVMVMGLGNYLYGDEGLGIHALQRLHQEKSLPEEVELVDGGTLGLNLLDVLEAAQRLIIIDCVDAHQEPGTPVQLNDNEIPRYFTQKMSIHQLGFNEVLALAQLRQTLPEKMILLGIQPANLEWGVELSSTVESAMPQLLSTIKEKVTEWLKNPD